MRKKRGKHMKRQGNMVQISPERLRLFCSKNGGQKAVSEALGYGKSFVSNALHSGRMSRAANKLLAATYGIPEDFFLAPDPPKTAQPPEPKDAQQGGARWVRAASFDIGQAGFPAAGTRRREGRQRILEAQRQQRAGADAGDQLRGTHDLQILRTKNAAGIYGG